MQEVQTTLPLGSIIGERYQVEALLGKGGFGAVYLVHDLRVKQNVFALKEIVDPDVRKRRHFTFEAEILKRIDHPSLPRVYRAFDDPARGRAYILMDYIDGSNLEQLRRQKPGQRMALRDVLILLGPVFEAVTYLHAQQPPIIHLDIKPANIIAPASGARTMLVDFGIAKEFDQEGTTTAIRYASPGYGAPEQYSTGTNMRTDLYGLGATLYTLLTGTVPTEAFFRLTQQAGRGSDPLVPVKQLIPAIPEHISAAIAQAMALEISERFATAEDFWQALHIDKIPTIAYVPVNSSSPILNESTAPFPAHSAPTSRPRRKRSALLLLLVLGVGLAAAFFAFPGLRGRQAASPAVLPSATITHAATTTPSSIQPTPTPTPTNTPASDPTLPVLDSAYNGMLHDNNGNVDASMSLSSISQHQQNIQGNFGVGPSLQGNGSFTGTVNSNAAIQFTIHTSNPSARAPLFFFGQIQKGGSISGQYCSLDATSQCNHAVGGYGTWSVNPNTSGS